MSASEYHNILIDPLPVTVEVAGEEVIIATDFRTGILFELLAQDGTIEKEDKAQAALELWYPKGLPVYTEESVIEAIDKMLWFYLCGKQNKQPPASDDKKPQSKGITRRIYDFDVDAPLIYAAFLAQYRIDLQDVESLHWWKFSAMFAGLSEEHEISKIMGYRSIELATIKNKAERERYTKLQAKYALPDNRSVEDKERMIGSLFGGMMR